MKQVLERRLELLKLEGLGLSQGEITKVLAEKYGLCTRTVQYDFEHRSAWQPMFTGVNPRAWQLKSLNRLEFLYREAAFILKTTQNDLAKLGAINSMRETVKEEVELLGLNAVKDLGSVQKMIIEIVDSVKYSAEQKKVKSVDVGIA